MNFKKNWKRFWTLSSAREGFTLVELIVVIAILAILAGVAVPAYSGYVKKANMQADITLISEIEHALTLAGYNGTFADVESGYITLSATTPFTSKQAGEGSALDIALKAAFGENYSLQLKYDGWGNNGMLGSLLNNSNPKDVANSVLNSSFVTGNAVEGLLKQVEDLTTAAGDIMANANISYDTMKTLLFNGSDILDATISELGITNPSDLSATELSNLLVLASAKEMNLYNANQLQGSPSQCAQMVYTYAQLVAFASSDTGKASQEVQSGYAALQEALANPEANKPADVGSIEFVMEQLTAFSQVCGNAATEADKNYYDVVEEHMPAFMQIMGAVDNAEVNRDDLGDTTLFTEGKGNTLFNNYLDTAEMISNMTDEEIAALKNAMGAGEGTIVVSYLLDGTSIKFTDTRSTN